jgi:hypothetical protein
MMEKITNFVSGRVLNFRVGRVARVAALTVAIVASLGALLPSTAQAQRRYIGNAYAARVGVNVLGGGGINVGVNLNDTGNLAPFTQQTLTGLTGAINAGTGGILTDNLLGATVQTVQTSSVFPAPTLPTSTVVLSTARVVNADILGSVVYSLLGLNLSATVIQSQTTAFFSGLTAGSTTLADLNFGSAFFNQNGTAATLQLDGNGQVVANQTFRVRVLGGLGSLLEVGSLTINEQRINADDSRTTEAIHLRLLDNSVLGTLANADIVVASSTAGYAPEPGSLALVAAGLLPAAALLRRRRRQLKK